MLGYDYEIIYKKGKENVVAHALSQKYEEERSLFSLSFILSNWVNEVCNEWFIKPNISNLIQYPQYDSNAYLGCTWHNDEIFYKRCLYFLKQSNFKSTMLSKLHSSPIAIHCIFHKTYEWIKCSSF